jgi:hypothetical protein
MRKVGKVKTRTYSRAPKFKNKAGMSLIINDLTLLNRPKAGMSMKTLKLYAKAGMLLMPSEILEIQESNFAYLT